MSETEALIMDLTQAGHCLEVVKARSGWSTFDVRQTVEARGWSFDAKTGQPFRVTAKRTRAGGRPHEALEDRAPVEAFVPSAPAPPVEVADGNPPAHVAVDVTHGDAGELSITIPTSEGPVTVPLGPGPQATVTVTLELDYMRLVRAIKDGLVSTDPKVKRLAERARDAGAELVAYLDHAAARAVAAADVERLRAELADAERRLRGDRPPPVAHATPSHRPETEETKRNRLIRAWALEQGLPVGKVGKVRRDVLEAYEAAHQ